jgi:hypothetical protein
LPYQTITNNNLKTKIMTLFERLSEENKTKLEILKLKYSNLGDDLIKTLKEKTAWTELTVYDANHLLQETSGKDLSINNLYDLFDA